MSTSPSPELKAYNPSKNSYWLESLAWLIRESGALMGETSNLLGTLSAIEGGGAGDTVPSSDEHHDAMIKRLGLDRPRTSPNIVARYRDLNARFKRLTRESQLIHLVYYEPRSTWPSGCQAHLGEELASVALAFAPDRARLMDACTHEGQEWAKSVISAAKERARSLIRAAHEEWLLVAPASDNSFKRALDAI